MLPAEWRNMSEQIVTDPFAIGAQFGNGMAEIAGAGSIGVLRARDELEELCPWRAYATVRLWRRASRRKDMKGPKP